MPPPNPPSRSIVKVIVSPATFPVYFVFISLPLNSRTTANVMVSPVIFPSVIGVSPPPPIGEGEEMVPVNSLPFALKT